MREQMSAKKDHVFGSIPGGCWCSKYHYRCAKCGEDCTMGEEAGPATTDTRGVTRCRECQHDWERLRGALSPWTKEEVQAIKVALSQIADDGDPLVVSNEDRKIATEILCRIEE